MPKQTENQPSLESEDLQPEPDCHCSGQCRVCQCRLRAERDEAS